jgi:hypothetical protein
VAPKAPALSLSSASFIRWIDSEVSFTSQFVVDRPPLQPDADYFVANRILPGARQFRIETLYSKQLVDQVRQIAK